MSGSLKKGSRIANRYVTTRKIGEGQFSAVYEVQDKDQKKYAVKIEKCKDVGPSVKQEHKTLQRVREVCPQMCHAIKCGSHTDGRFFILMHLLGMNLVEARKAEPGGRMQPGDVKRIAACVLDALKAVHSAGYVHRDVKPANIAQVPPESRQALEWMLIDFGLARKYVDHEGNLVPPRPESKDNFRGSTTYASVHAHTGQDLGRRDDLFSWLYVVAELLEGTLPWRRESHAADRECGHHHAASGGPSSGVQGATSATSAAAAAATLAGDYREAVRASKQQCVADPVHLVPTCPFPEPFVQAANYLARLSFESEPDYTFLHNCLAQFPDHWPPIACPPYLTNGAVHPHSLQQQQQQQHYRLLHTTPSPLARPPMAPWHDLPPPTTLTPPHFTPPPCTAMPPTTLFPPHLPDQQASAAAAAPLQQHPHTLGITPTPCSTTQHAAAAGMGAGMASRSTLQAATFCQPPPPDAQHAAPMPFHQGINTGSSTALQPAATLYPALPSDTQCGLTSMPLQQSMSTGTALPVSAPPPGLVHTDNHSPQPPLPPGYGVGTGAAQPQPFLQACRVGGQIGRHSPQPPLPPGYGGYGAGAGVQPSHPLQQQQQQQQEQQLYQQQWQHHQQHQHYPQHAYHALHQQQQQQWQQHPQQQHHQGPFPHYFPSPQPLHAPLSPVSPAAPPSIAHSPSCPPPLPPEPYPTTTAIPDAAATAHHSAFPEHLPPPSLLHQQYHHQYHQQQQQQQQAGLPLPIHSMPSVHAAHSAAPPTPPFPHLPQPSPLPAPAQLAAVKPLICSEAVDAAVKPLSPGTYLEGGGGEGEGEQQEGRGTVQGGWTGGSREAANLATEAEGLGKQGGSVEQRDAKRARVEGWAGLSSPVAGDLKDHHRCQQQLQVAHEWGGWVVGENMHGNGIMSAAEGEAGALGRVRHAIAHLEQSQQLMLDGGQGAARARHMLAAINPADALTVMASVACTGVQRVHGEPDCSNMATQLADLSVFMRHCAQLAQQRGSQHRQ